MICFLEHRMTDRKMEAVQKRLEMIETRLSNAEHYLALQVNIEGSAFLHLDDWRGKSGHPLWVRNFMIPTTQKYRARTEIILDEIDKKAKQKALALRRRRKDTEVVAPPGD
jgi:hypothetical protein